MAGFILFYFAQLISPLLVPEILVKYCCFCVSHCQLQTLKVNLEESDERAGDDVLGGKIEGVKYV